MWLPAEQHASQLSCAAQSRTAGSSLRSLWLEDVGARGPSGTNVRVGAKPMTGWRCERRGWRLDAEESRLLLLGGTDTHRRAGCCWAERIRAGVGETRPRSAGLGGGAFFASAHGTAVHRCYAATAGCVRTHVGKRICCLAGHGSRHEKEGGGAREEGGSGKLLLALLELMVLRR